MSALRVLAGSILCFNVFVIATAQAPIAGKIYAIQSTMDGGTIKPSRGGGEICESLGDIGFSYFPPTPYTDEYLWYLVPANETTGSFTIYSVLDDGRTHVNPLTYDDLPPYCNPLEREVRVIPHATQPSFKIQDVKSGNKYLYSYGSEVGIVIWRDDPYTQYWLFHEVNIIL